MRFYNAYSPKVDINQFVFDKIYGSYADLQADVNNSDILPGRYVLIRYSTEVIQSVYPEITDNKNFDGSVALNTEAADQNLREDIANYNTTVWRKTHSNGYELIAQLEPSQAIANLLNTEKGKALIKEAISDVITATVNDTTSIGNSYTIPQYEKNGDTLIYKGGIPIFSDVTLVLNGVLE